MKKILFICTGNVYRSKQAAALIAQYSDCETRSAGTAPVQGGVAVSQEDIDWADEIFVMSEKEDHHETFLKSHFNLGQKEIRVLGIPNNYGESAEEQKMLHSLLIEKLRPYFPGVPS